MRRHRLDCLAGQFARASMMVDARQEIVTTLPRDPVPEGKAKEAETVSYIGGILVALLHAVLRWVPRCALVPTASRWDSRSATCSKEVP